MASDDVLRAKLELLGSVAAAASASNTPAKAAAGGKGVALGGDDETVDTASLPSPQLQARAALPVPPQPGSAHAACAHQAPVAPLDRSAAALQTSGGAAHTAGG